MWSFVRARFCVKAQGIHIDDLQILQGKFRGYGIESVKVLAVVLVVADDAVRRFKVYGCAFRKIRAEGGSVFLLVLGHGETQRPAQTADEPFGEALEFASLLDHPPLAITLEPALFVGTDVGQLWRVGVGPVEAVGIPFERQGRGISRPMSTQSTASAFSRTERPARRLAR